MKPENSFIFREDKGGQSRWTAKIGDLGLAQKTGSRAPPCGTPNFIAPELLREVGAVVYVDTASDMWSFGVLIVE